jgi:queuosine precursor transporter
MNTGLFFIHLLIVGGFTLGAIRKGREALISWIALQAILANLFVVKQISLFGFEVTPSDAFAVGSLLGLNSLQRAFGQESAKKAIWITFYSMAFFAIASQIHLLYKPSSHDTSHASFVTVLSHSPRLLIASLLTFFIAQRVDLWMFGKLRTEHFSLANLFSLLVSQFLDTLLFSFLGLYGLVASLFDIILVSYLLKVVTILLLTPLTFVTLRKTHV